MQRFIANKMKETVANNPQAVTCFDVEMGPIFDLKKKLEADGSKVTVAALLIKAASVALMKQPIMNSRFIDGEIHVYDEVNMGVAMAIPRGLIVPVIRNTEKKSCREISDELKEIKRKFESNSLTPEDMQGATATITSLGPGKNHICLPILNGDQTLMVGAGSTRRLPAEMDDGTIGIKEFMNISITSNHCIVYGAEVSEFCSVLGEIIEKASDYIV